MDKVYTSILFRVFSSLPITSLVLKLRIFENYEFLKITNLLVTDFRISFNPGLNSAEVPVQYYYCQCLTHACVYRTETKLNIKYIGLNHLQYPYIHKFKVQAYDAPNISLLLLNLIYLY